MTAHDRRRYLPDALRSLEAQTLDKDRFEVIVVKNFEDPASDEIIRRNGWKDVVTDVVPVGGKIAVGLEEAKGDVITFLEDDDMYRPERLERVYEAFSKVPALVYFHNNQLLVNHEGKPLYRLPKSSQLDTIILPSRMLSKVGSETGLCYFQFLPMVPSIKSFHDFNLSSMAVRRSLLNSRIDLIEHTGLAIDVAIYVAAITSEGFAMFTNEPLTYYRVHTESTTNISSTSPDKLNRRMHYTKKPYISFAWPCPGIR